MRGAIPALLQYAFMVWCLVKAQGQFYLTLSLNRHLSFHVNDKQLDLTWDGPAALPMTLRKGLTTAERPRIRSCDLHHIDCLLTCGRSCLDTRK
jgi:hypothetical protein